MWVDAACKHLAWALRECSVIAPALSLRITSPPVSAISRSEPRTATVPVATDSLPGHRTARQRGPPRRRSDRSTIDYVSAGPALPQRSLSGPHLAARAGCYRTYVAAQPSPRSALITSCTSATFTTPLWSKSLRTGARPRSSLRMNCTSATVKAPMPATSQAVAI